MRDCKTSPSRFSRVRRIKNPRVVCVYFHWSRSGGLIFLSSQLVYLLPLALEFGLILIYLLLLLVLCLLLSLKLVTDKGSGT